MGGTNMCGRFGRQLLVVTWVLAGLAACSNSSDKPKDDVAQADGLGDGSTSDVTPDLGTGDVALPDGTDDLQPLDLQAPDVVEDVALDVQPELTPLPVEPPTLAAELVLTDSPYVQEFNHTWNEMEPEVGELVALVKPPSTFESFDAPTLVAPDGVLVRDEAGILTPSALPEGEVGPIVAAGATADRMVVATAGALYEVGSDAVLHLIEAFPEGHTLRRLAASAKGVDVVTDGGWGIDSDGTGVKWLSDESDIQVVLRTAEGTVVAHSDSLVGYVGTALPPSAPAWTVELSVGVPVAILADRTLPTALAYVVVGETGVAGFVKSGQGVAETSVPLFEAGRIPLLNARTAVPIENGGFAVAALGGAYRVIDRGSEPEYRVYAAQRWMPSENARDILAPVGADSILYFATDQGLGHVTTSQWTVADKMEPMVDRIVQRHDRDGAVADSHLITPGDLSTNIPYDSDNDGGWTCYWVLSECFRYKVTGDPAAKAHFDKSLDRMLSLRTLTGTEYFLARAVIRIDGCNLDDCDAPNDGEWFKSPDGEWWVKGNTSNDEVTSHMFMMGLAHDLCADDTQKAAIVAHIDGIVGGLVDNGYKLIDPQDGEPTKFGQFDPLYVNWWVEGQWGDGGRRSAQILGAINLAHYLTGKQKYLDARAFLMGENHYGENIDHVGDAKIYSFCAGSGDCDELGMQAFFP